MTESINPVALAEEAGVVYKEGGETPVYALIQVKKDAESNEILDVDISTDGLSESQTIAVLEAVLENLKADKANSREGSDIKILPA